MNQMSIQNIWPDWQIVREIGRGSFGTVYEAVHSEYGVESRAAIKVISVPQDEEEVRSLCNEGYSEYEARTYFRRAVDGYINEIKHLKTLQGMQNIVSLEEFKVDERQDGIGWTIYIRMELLTPLTAFWDEKSRTEQDVIKLGCDICSALERCNQIGVIHRDIKPENIFVNSFGDYKLGDFGIARRLDFASVATSKTGTPYYIWHQR